MSLFTLYNLIKVISGVFQSSQGEIDEKEKLNKEDEKREPKDVPTLFQFQTKLILSIAEK